MSCAETTCWAKVFDTLHWHVIRAGVGRGKVTNRCWPSGSSSPYIFTFPGVLSIACRALMFVHSRNWCGSISVMASWVFLEGHMTSDFLSKPVYCDRFRTRSSGGDLDTWLVQPTQWHRLACFLVCEKQGWVSLPAAPKHSYPLNDRLVLLLRLLHRVPDMSFGIVSLGKKCIRNYIMIVVLRVISIELGSRCIWSEPLALFVTHAADLHVADLHSVGLHSTCDCLSHRWRQCWLCIDCNLISITRRGLMYQWDACSLFD